MQGIVKQTWTGGFSCEYTLIVGISSLDGRGTDYKSKITERDGIASDTPCMRNSILSHLINDEFENRLISFGSRTLMYEAVRSLGQTVLCQSVLI